ncbi:receptor-transporting protein 3-like isoform X1 [Asterias amurensis]|uniref:receptor-transporting protein 3-like isoform X1 n=1 Tax=Asterias amurensis TaxID=7602 RepID=UPI003AB13EC4
MLDYHQKQTPRMYQGQGLPPAVQSKLLPGRDLVWAGPETSLIRYGGRSTAPPEPVDVEKNSAGKRMINTPQNMAAPDLAMMDEIWNGEFAKVFQPYLPHIWYLSPTEVCPSPRWRRFKDSAKVRFCCQTCGHGWTSMKGRVVFWYFLHIPYCEGYVQFKLYGQQCQRCNNGMFEPAMWYPEEVNKVLCNLYNRIGQTYYGFVKPPIRYDRRAGKPRTQHNATLCQACRDGECDSRPRTTTPTSGHVAVPSPTPGTTKLQVVRV